VPPKTRQKEKDVARVRAFGERVRELRPAQGLTQEKLGYLAKITMAEVGAIERAEREPGLVEIMRLADGLGLSLEALAQVNSSASGARPVTRSLRR
jgi:transcriptional regulator with XRE-family HTH domain